MGYAIARAAREAGASVTLISGPTALDTPYHVNRVDVMTAIEMRDAVMSHISHQDIFISVAAVADWQMCIRDRFEGIGFAVFTDDRHRFSRIRHQFCRTRQIIVIQQSLENRIGDPS